MFNYNEAPSDEVFNDIKNKSIEIWNTYDDTYWYATEKIDRIKDIENIRDNVRYIFGMFDIHNQSKLMQLVGEDAKALLNEYRKDAYNSLLLDRLSDV
jgi:hypothetical protein